MSNIYQLKSWCQLNAGQAGGSSTVFLAQWTDESTLLLSCTTVNIEVARQEHHEGDKALESTISIFSAALHV